MLDNRMACITWTIQICPQTLKVTPLFSLIQQRPTGRRSFYITVALDILPLGS